MKKYVKLGSKAEVFHDPYSDLLVNKNHVVLLTGRALSSLKVKKALNTGHLVRSSEDEFEEFISTKTPVDTNLSDTTSLKKALDSKEAENRELREKLALLETGDDDEGDFEGMNKTELIEYYQENYEVDDDELTRFKKLKRKEMVNELLKSE